MSKAQQIAELILLGYSQEDAQEIVASK